MTQQPSLFHNDKWLPIRAGGLLYWDPQFLSPRQAQRYFHQLRSELPWTQEAITLFGKPVLQPRLQAWCGDAIYRYSGLTMQPSPWTDSLLELRQRCEQASGTQFNSVLANLYRHGQDSMGWHQDNEPELGKNPIIASLTLGESRRFLLQHIETKEKIEFELQAGSLLVMAGTTQTYWRHCVPKTAKSKAERINLTFRHVNSTVY
ncbi:alpha-ketoglutarate-dependent dioxygenase AlkB family protein [Vibrio navarrensis]|uniref:alpha-ketoglutarate-dependent dioxygenase AlkB family protein n=1 Tax=Vibrio navarrensis TaxID=29495 RepID=UPI00051D5B85|nr:alpha-ketoglutarate-dependent dioxygenase AlkB [Vibrio navarrensis]KGK14351.1 DNA repair protein [Vibrio navarrensis]